MTTQTISADTRPLENMEVLVPPTLLAQYETSCATDPGAIGAAVAAAFKQVRAFLALHRITAAGPPRVTYGAWSEGAVRFAAAIPITALPPNDEKLGDVAVVAAPEVQALRFVHYGPYRDIRATYDRIEAFLRARGGIRTPADWARYSPMWEEYMNDPATTPESELITRIYLTLP